MEDLFSDQPTPGGWGEPESTGEECPLSIEIEAASEAEVLTFMENLIVGNPVQIIPNPAQILDNQAQAMDNPAEIMDNPAQFMVNPPQIMVNPPQIMINSIQIVDPSINIEFVEDPIELVEHPVELPELTTTVIKKRKMPEADQETLAHYMQCQKFRLPNWSSVRYAPVKDQFQAYPGFCALKPNDMLSEITPNSKSNDLLRRFDLTCGAMVNGLLQNLMIFNETVNTLPQTVQNRVNKEFNSQDSRYKKNAEGLLQYTCGRRQEIMQDRRKLYKPPNKVHKKALYEIPPSETHLFEDNAFMNLVGQIGRFDKIFPTLKKQGAKASYRYQRANQNQQHSNSHRIRIARNYQARCPE